ncbi:MAG TPA: hypothetical protein VJS11_11435 [Acidobacteriaceae bacterium]|nr:hypothetical protein [Acidobacteriaceae bacterium]
MIPHSAAENTAVLTSWKEIARYMGKGVRTVQRWEQDFGLPVRRPLGSDKKAVLARPRDLDMWLALRCGMQDRAVAQRDPKNAMLVIRTSLATELETSRMLREANRAMRLELNLAVKELHLQLEQLCKRAA